jgi:hypothetical protein
MSGPQRRGGRAEKCTFGVDLTMTASARVMRTPVHNRLDNRVFRLSVANAAPSRLQTPQAHFSN